MDDGAGIRDDGTGSGPWPGRARLPAAGGTVLKILTLRFLVSYSAIFCVGSTWMTLLPLQILRTYNNQYSRLLETRLSLQRCPEGIRLSFRLLAAPFRITE